MGNLNRKDLETRYIMFEYFALRDQRAYYDRTVAKHSEASSQVNRLRATISLFTGISAATAGFIVAVYFTSTGACNLAVTDAAGSIPSFCSSLQIVVDIAIILSVALPALGGFFGTLADLYQWDKQITIYKAAMDNIEVADAHSPYPEMDDIFFRASLDAYAQGTLQVMSDETAQWGQSIRTPKGLQSYVEEAREKAAKVGGDANAGREEEIATSFPPSNIPSATPTTSAANPPVETTLPPAEAPAPLPPSDTTTTSGEGDSAG